jgi:hypothetical protein
MGRVPGRIVDIASALFRSIMTQRFVTWMSGAMFALFIAFMAAVPFLHPEYNWDMAPYLAVALEEEIPDPAALHEKVWGMMKAGATEDQFRQLTTANAYNMAEYANPDFFHSQLVFYRVKVAYTTLIKELGPVIGYVETTQLINTVSVIIIGAALMLWLRREKMLQSALVLGPVMLLGSFLTMAQLAMPDLLGTAILILAVYLVRIGKDWWAVPLLFAAFLVRTDMIIFLFALVLASAALGGRVLPALAAFVLALAAYGPISDGAGHPGWWTHYYFTNVEIQNDMRGFHPDFSLKDYIEGLVRGITSSFRFHHWLTLFALLLVGWLALLRAGKVPRHGVVATLLTAQVLCIVGKFVVFPLPESRVYFAYILLMAVLLLEVWKPRFDLEDVPLPARPAAA